MFITISQYIRPNLLYYTILGYIAKKKGKPTLKVSKKKILFYKSKELSLFKNAVQMEKLTEIIVFNEDLNKNKSRFERNFAMKGKGN